MRAIEKPILLIYKHWSGDPISEFTALISKDSDIYFYFELFYLFVWTRLYDISSVDIPTIEWEKVRDRFRVWLIDLFGRGDYAFGRAAKVVDAIQSFMDRACSITDRAPA